MFGVRRIFVLLPKLHILKKLVVFDIIFLWLLIFLMKQKNAMLFDILFCFSLMYVRSLNYIFAAINCELVKSELPRTQVRTTEDTSPNYRGHKSELCVLGIEKRPVFNLLQRSLQM